MNQIFNICLQHKLGLSLTYALMILENICAVIYPFAIGVAVDGVINNNPSMIFYFVALWLFHLAIGSFRHVYDTHIFTKIYNEMAIGAIANLKDNRVEDSKIAARISLARELTEFMQIEVPAIVTAVVVFSGSITMLFFYDLWIGFLALACFIPAAMINFWFFNKSFELNERLNDQIEKEISIISSLKKSVIGHHFKALRLSQIKISNAEAKTWGAIEIVLCLLVVAVLLRLGNIEHITAGFIYTALSYLWNIYDEILQVPNIVQNLARALDISERLKQENT